MSRRCRRKIDDRAIEYYEKALIIAHEIGDRRGEGNALGNLGNAYKRLGQSQRASKYHEQSLQIAREIGNRLNEASALFNMSLAMKEMGNRTEAISHAESSLKIYDQIEGPDAAMVRGLLAKWREETEDGGTT